MRREPIAALLVALALALTACGAPTAAPTDSPGASPTAPPTATATAAPSPAATSTPGPTSTPAPNASPTPTPLPLLPLRALDYLVIGMTPSCLYNLQFIATGTDAANDFVLPDGRAVHFDISEDYGPLGPFVTSYRIGTSAPVVAVPDAAPIKDGQVTVGGIPLEIWQVVDVDGLIATIGAPADDVTVEDELYSPGSDYLQVRQRTLTYPGLTLVFDQKRTAADKTVWNLGSVQFTSASYATPRGLRIGLTAKQVLMHYGTGTFIIEESGSTDGIQAMTLTEFGSTSSAQDDPTSVQAHLQFMGGAVARIELTYYSGP